PVGTEGFWQGWEAKESPVSPRCPQGSDTLLQWTPVDESSDSTQIAYSKKDPSSCPTEEELFDPGYEPDWAVISTVGSRPAGQDESCRGAEPSSARQWAFTLSLAELKSIRKSKPGLGWSYLIFITKDGISIQALHFHRGGTKALLRALCKYVILLPGTGWIVGGAGIGRGRADLGAAGISEPWKGCYGTVEGCKQPCNLSAFPQHSNFEESQESMKRQLVQLTLLLRVLDPPLCDYLDSKESGSLCFCFRWILIWFKREFAFSEVLLLWEVLWTELPCPNFHLLVACAILDAERQALMHSGFGFNEILKHINELTMKMSVEEILCRAEAIYRQLAATPELPLNVQELLGLGEAKVGTPSTDTASSPQPLSPSQAPELELTDSISASQPDSSIEILPPEETGGPHSLSP
uniref:TBC1 domain family member 17 n=1 Tax=Sphenodon punctatus TaxID=8508 RepID=A0A8D0HK24_SPHPU